MDETYRATMEWRSRWYSPVKKHLKISKTFNDKAEALRWMIAVLDETESYIWRPVISASLLGAADGE